MPKQAKIIFNSDGEINIKALRYGHFFSDTQFGKILQFVRFNGSVISAIDETGQIVSCTPEKGESRVYLFVPVYPKSRKK